MTATSPIVIPPVQRVTVLGQPMAYRSWGDRTGQPMLFFHALGTAPSGAYVAEIAPQLVDRDGLWIVAPDAPGFGEAPALARDDYEMGPMVDRCAAVVAELQLHRPILMGHSWGGVVAAFLAARLGSEAGGLVLVDSGHIDYQDTPGFDRETQYETLLEEARRPDRNFEPQPWDRFEEELRGEVRRWSPVIPAIVRAGVRMEDGLVRQIPRPEVAAAVRHALIGRRVSDLSGDRCGGHSGPAAHRRRAA